MCSSLRSLVLVVMLLIARVGMASDDLGLLLERARAERSAGHYAEALVAYDGMLAIVATHETALFERSETLGWAGRLTEALDGYRAFAAHYPARAHEAQLRIAQVEAWGDEYAAAERTLTPWVQQGDRRAVLDSSLYLAWGGKLDASLQRLSSWLAGHRDDREAMALRARISSWAGDFQTARTDWETVLREDPMDLESTLGLVRLSLWEGDTAGARDRFETLPREKQEQPEAATLSAQLAAAAGQPREARKRLRSLVQVDNPARNDAFRLLADLTDTQGPWLDSSYVRTSTSDGLTNVDPTAQIRVPAGEGYVQLGWTARSLELDTTQADLSLARASGAMPLGGHASLNAGLTRANEVAGEPAWGGNLGVDLTVARRINLSATWSRAYADFTPRALASRTAIDALDLSGSWTFKSGAHVVRGGAGRQSLSAGSTRNSALLAYEHRWSITSLRLRSGAVARRFGYSKSLPLGFFNPERYRYAGVTAGASFAGNARWDMSCDLNAGWQAVDDAARQFAWGYSIGAGWSSARRRLSIYVTWATSVAGLPVTDAVDPSSYRDNTLRLSLRVRGN